MLTAPEFPSFVHVVNDRAITNPDKKIFTYLSDGESKELYLTYRQLYDRAALVASAINRESSPGDRVLLICMPGLEYIISLFGCLFARVVAVPAYPPRSNHHYERIDHIVNDVGAKVGLTTTSAIPGLKGVVANNPTMQKLKWINLDEISADLGGVCDLDATSNSLAVIQYTSGSTTTPRGVKLTHRNLIINSQMIAELFEADPQLDSGCLWLPPYHDMGLIGGILQPIYHGGHSVLMSPVAFLQRPVRWLRAISKFETTISVAPNFAYQYCAEKISEADLDGLNLQSWKVAGNGAEMIRLNTIDKFAKRFEPYGFERKAFLGCYGLAEATLIVTGGGRDREVSVCQHENRYLVGSGRPLSTTVLKIVNRETNKECSEGEEGEILVCSESVASGYWQNEILTNETFQAKVNGYPGKDFLKTGDLGFVSNGELYVTARIKDLIIIRGRNLYSHDLEGAIFDSHSALVPSGGAAISADFNGEEALVIIHEVVRSARKTNLNEVVTAILACLSETYQLSPATIILVLPASLPKTSSGKIQRYECKRRFLTEAFEPLLTWKNPEFFSERGQTTSSIFPIEDANFKLEDIRSWLIQEISNNSTQAEEKITGESLVLSLGLDSLKIAQLATTIEDKFQISLPGDLFLEGQTIGKIAAIVHAQIVAKSVPAVDLASNQIAGGAARKIARNPDVVARGSLSRCQNRMWYFQSLAPDSPAHNIGFVAEINGEINLDIARSAIKNICNAHSIFKTIYKIEGDQVFQHILKDFEVNVEFMDLVHVLREEGRAEINADIELLVRKPFELSQHPPVRMKIYQFGENKAVGVLVVHHIAFDGWSAGIFLKNLVAEYLRLSKNGQSSLILPEVSYIDYAISEKYWLDNQQFETEKEYWKNRLDKELDPTWAEIPFAYRIPVWKGRRANFSIAQPLVSGLSEYSRQKQVTPFVILLTGLFLLLGRETQMKHLIISSMFANRKNQQTHNLIGFIANTILLAVNFDHREISVAQLVQRVGTQVRGAFENQELPFEEILNLNPIAKKVYYGSMQIMLVYQAFDAWEVSVPDYSFEFNDVDTGESRFDLLVIIRRRSSGALTATIEYRADLFKEEQVQRLREEYEKSIQYIIDSSDEPIGRYLTDSGKSVFTTSLITESTTYGGGKPNPDLSIEDQLREVFSLILNVPISQVSPDDNFFALGGDSLRGVQATLRLQGIYNVNLTPRELLENPTPRALAQAILANQMSRLSNEQIHELLEKIETDR